MGGSASNVCSGSNGTNDGSGSEMKKQKTRLNLLVDVVGVAFAGVACNHFADEAGEEEHYA